MGIELRQTQSHRFHYMDGLRGIASLAVCFWHNFLAFFPGAVDSGVAVKSHFIEERLYRSPFNVFFAGDFSVYIFFMLSGFVISVKFFSAYNPEVLKKAYLRRYVRLMPPAFVTVVASYVLIKFGFMYNRQAALISQSWWLNYNWRDVTPSLWGAIHYGVYDMWFVGVSAGSSYNSNLGTLLVELLGSYVIFSFIYFSGLFSLKSGVRYFAHCLLIVGSFVLYKDDPHYSVFFCGMAVADLYQNTTLFGNAFLRRCGVLIFIVGVLLGAANIGNLPRYPYHKLEEIFRALGLHPLSYPWALGAVCLVVGLILSNSLQRIFEKRFFQILGEYSFALFVTHTVFLGSITCWLFVKASNVWMFDYVSSVAIAFFGSAVFLMFATYLVKKVDDVSVAWSKHF